MTFLPILERELRVRARKRSTYWTRCGVGLAGALICLPQLLASNPFGTASSTSGQHVFNGIVGGAFLLSCSACLMTADALCAERQEGTLGLLLLTRVRSIDVLLGKLGSVGLTSLCVLIAFLPVLMLTVLAGGVTGVEALRKGLALLNTLFFSLAVGLWGSTTKRQGPKPILFVSLLMSAFVLAPLLERWLTNAPYVLGFLSPIGAMLLAGENSAQAAQAFWTSLAIVHSLAWGLLLWAGVRLEGAMRESDGDNFEGSSALGRAARAIPRRRRDQPLGDREPIEWLVCRQRGVRAAIWLAVMLSVVYQTSMMWYPRMRGGPFGSVWYFSYALMQLPGLAVSLVSTGLLAWGASRFFVEARQSRALELLFTTPVASKSVVFGQWSAWKRLLRWPVLVMLAPMLIRFLFGPVIWKRPGVTVVWRGYDVVSVALGVLTTLLSFGALGWMGMWFGLKARSRVGAVLWPVSLVRVVPFFISTSGLIFLSPFILRPLLGVRFSYYYLISWLPQAAVLFFYLWLMHRARNKLMRALAGPEPARLKESIADAVLSAAGAVQRIRHWTPS